MRPVWQQKYRKDIELLQFPDGLLLIRRFRRLMFDRRLLPDLLRIF
jgi:hypothetical protein